MAYAAPGTGLANGRIIRKKQRDARLDAERKEQDRKNARMAARTAHQVYLAALKAHGQVVKGHVIQEETA